MGKNIRTKTFVSKGIFSKKYVTQICNNFTYLYAFIHNDIYHLAYVSIIRKKSKRTI